MAIKKKNGYAVIDKMKQIRVTIVDTVKNNPKKYTAVQLCEMFDITEHNISYIISRYELNNLLKKRTDTASTDTASIDSLSRGKINEIIKKLRKITPFIRIRGGTQQFCGEWDILDIQLRANGHKVKWFDTNTSKYDRRYALKAEIKIR